MKECNLLERRFFEKRNKSHQDNLDVSNNRGNRYKRDKNSLISLKHIS